jgi:NADP-dependent 3-hydroxy acid dehydrogenase YdfG
MTMGRLEGTVAVKTGASAGIGAGTAGLFAKEGAAVALTAYSADRLKELGGKIAMAGGWALAVPGDGGLDGINR